MTETENQNVQKPEEMNNQNNNIQKRKSDNEIAVLIKYRQTKKNRIRDWLGR